MRTSGSRLKSPVMIVVNGRRRVERIPGGADDAAQPRVACALGVDRARASTWAVRFLRP